MMSGIELEDRIDLNDIKEEDKIHIHCGPHVVGKDAIAYCGKKIQCRGDWPNWEQDPNLCKECLIVHFSRGVND